MASALAMARRNLGQTSPNPSVGAVIVAPTPPRGPAATKTGEQIIARAVTGHGGTPHAEPQAIETARAAIGVEALKDATLYVTLEPCNHQGRTPPCTEAIIKAGIKRVVIAGDDHDERVKGGGIAKLKAAGIKVTVGICKAAANRLSLGHTLLKTENRPAILIKSALSADGLILPASDGSAATGNGTGPRWVTSPLARRRGQLLRAEADCILIGRGTALADDPSLTCRLNGMAARSPQPILLDSRLSLPKHLKLFQTSAISADMAAMQPLVAYDQAISSAEVKAYGTERSATLIPIKRSSEGGVDLRALATAIAARGFTRMMVEGGPTLSGRLIKAGLFDQLNIFIGAQNAGPEGIAPFDGESLEWALEAWPLNLEYSQTLGDNLMHQYIRSDREIAAV